jgi:hypothetical protein
VSTGFCSISFWRATPCYALTQTGNWCRYLRGYLGAFRPVESAKREASTPPNRDRPLPLRQSGLSNRERIIACFLYYHLVIKLLPSKKGAFLLRRPRRGARPLACWQLLGRQLPGIYERPLHRFFASPAGGNALPTPERVLAIAAP